MRSLVVLSLVLAAAAACGSDTTVVDDSGAGGAATGGASAGGANFGGGGQQDLGCPDDGDCRATSCSGPFNDLSGCAFTYSCDEPLSCQVPTFLVDMTTSEVTIQGMSASDATCILTGLRAGTPGAYRWYRTGAQIPGQFSTTRTLIVFEGRRALLLDSGAQDLGASAAFLGPTPLQDVTYFDACLVETAPDAILACLNGAYAPSCP